MKFKSLFYCFVVVSFFSSNIVLANDFEDDFMVVEDEFVEDNFEEESDVFNSDEDFIPEGEVQNPNDIPIANPERKVLVVGTRELFNKLKYGQIFTVDDVYGWVQNTSNINECLENGRTMLLQMVANSSNLEAIAILLDRGADLVTNCNPSYNALFIAVQNNKSPAVTDLLITKGADVVVKDFEGSNALSIAAASNPNPGVTETLLEYGLRINDKNNFGFTPLMLAAHKNNIDVVKMLIKSGANVNILDNKGRSALMAAAVRGDDEIMQLLIKSGADFKLVDKKKMSVLDYYNKNKYLKDKDFVENEFASPSERLERQYGYIANNHYKYNEELKKAIMGNNPEVDVEVAINRLADINILDDKGCTPLINAANNNSSVKVFELLVRAHADVNAKCLKNITASMIVSTQAQNQELAQIAIDKLDLLNENELDVNQKDINGDTALMYALSNKADISYIEKLLAMNADVNVVNKIGDTPIWVALKNDLPIRVLEILIENGANVNTISMNGENVLWYLLNRNADAERIILMLASGVDTSRVNTLGKTPLWHILINGGREDILHALIKYERNINEPDARGDTVLLYAVKNEYPAEIIKSMLYYGADPEMRDAKGRNTMDILSANQFFQETIKKQTRENVLNQW